MTGLPALFGRARELGLSEDELRAVAQGVTGSESLKGHSRQTYIKILNKMGPPVRRPVQANGILAKKLQALWIAGYNLGVIANRRDEAMIAFLKRQTGLDHHQFLRNADDAQKAIDALKLWLRRATGNEELFTRDKNLPKLYNDYRFQVCVHIWFELVKRDVAPCGTLTAYIVQQTGNAKPETLPSKDWIDLQNRLGTLWRSVKT